MKLERTFSIPENEITVHRRVAAFFEQTGYKPADSQSLMVYRRGSRLGSWFSFSPKGWRANATVRLAPISDQSQVTVTMDVDTTGQWVTDKERIFWNSELDCLEASVRTGRVDAAPSGGSAQSALAQNMQALVLIILLEMAFGIGAYILSGSGILGQVASLIGFVVGLVIAGLWFKSKIGG